MTKTTAVMLVLGVLLGGCNKNKRKAEAPERGGGGPAHAPALPEQPPATAMLVLIEGARIFAGDDDYVQPTPNGDQPRTGALKVAKQATLELAGSVERGVVGVSFYGAQVELRIPFGPVAELRALDSVVQKDFEKQRMRGFLAAVDVSLSELMKRDEERRVLVVIADGVDGAGDSQAIGALVAKARRAGIKVFTLQVQDLDDPMTDHTNMKALGELGGFRSTQNAQELPTFAKVFKDQI